MPAPDAGDPDAGPPPSCPGEIDLETELLRVRDVMALLGFETPVPDGTHAEVTAVEPATLELTTDDGEVLTFRWVARAEALGDLFRLGSPVQVRMADGWQVIVGLDYSVALALLDQESRPPDRDLSALHIRTDSVRVGFRPVCAATTLGVDGALEGSIEELVVDRYGTQTRLEAGDELSTGTVSVGYEGGVSVSCCSPQFVAVAWVVAEFLCVC